MDKKILIPFLIILVLIIGGIIIIIFNKNKKSNNEKILDDNINGKYEHGELIEIYYQKDASYHGGIDHISITKEEDNYKLMTEHSYENGEPIEIVEYKITGEEFKELEDYIIKYNLPSWNNFGPPEYEELDGYFQHLSITYKEEINGVLREKSYTIGYDQNIPGRGFKLLHDFTDKMQSLAKKENILKEYTKEDV